MAYLLDGLTFWQLLPRSYTCTSTAWTVSRQEQLGHRHLWVNYSIMVRRIDLPCSFFSCIFILSMPLYCRMWRICRAFDFIDTDHNPSVVSWLENCHLSSVRFCTLVDGAFGRISYRCNVIWEWIVWRYWGKLCSIYHPHADLYSWAWSLELSTLE